MPCGMDAIRVDCTQENRALARHGADFKVWTTGPIDWKEVE